VIKKSLLSGIKTRLANLEYSRRGKRQFYFCCFSGFYLAFWDIPLPTRLSSKQALFPQNYMIETENLFMKSIPIKKSPIKA
jgi:hypothetical protein